MLIERSSLQRVSLFAGRIGDNGAAHIAGRSSPLCWPALQHLDLGACEVSLAGVQCMVTALRAGVLPSLQVSFSLCGLACMTSWLLAACGCYIFHLSRVQGLSLAANPAAEQHDELEKALAALHDSRAEIDVAWRGM